ncbi:hypothetical protein GCM10009075_03610 [Sphingomonas trueperi]
MLGNLANPGFGRIARDTAQQGIAPAEALRQCRGFEARSGPHYISSGNGPAEPQTRTCRRFPKGLIVAGVRLSNRARAPVSE